MTKNKLNKQLFQIIPDLVLYSYFSLGNLSTKDGSNMPFITWPNGAPCLLVNLYMLALRDRPGRRQRQGLSRRGSKGGTMGNYASKLSQLIRFCFANRWDFIDLTDGRFSQFINETRAECAEYNPEVKKKNENTVTDVGRVCLDFLNFVGNFHGDESFVSGEGTIRAERKDAEIKISGQGSGKKKNVTYWHHHSFSGGERLRTRNPISNENIQRLRDAVNDRDSSRFIMMRRQIQITCLESTGGRVGELAELRVSDVLKAEYMKEPMLRIATLKKGDNEYRVIPVTKMFINELKTYILIQRRKIIKNTVGLNNDHDHLFISETTGKPLKNETLSEEIYRIRIAAGISEQACAHMFRHTFITNLLVLLIIRHKVENEDEFRVRILSDKTLKAEVMQWTGHASEESLNHYIKPAFASVTNYATTVSSVHIVRVHKEYDRRQIELVAKLEDGMPITQYKEELEKLMNLRNEDFQIAQQRDNSQ